MKGPAAACVPGTENRQLQTPETFPRASAASVPGKPAKPPELHPAPARVSLQRAAGDGIETKEMTFWAAQVADGGVRTTRQVEAAVRGQEGSEQKAWRGGPAAPRDTERQQKSQRRGKRSLNYPNGAAHPGCCHRRWYQPELCLPATQESAELNSLETLHIPAQQHTVKHAANSRLQHSPYGWGLGGITMAGLGGAESPGVWARRAAI